MSLRDYEIGYKIGQGSYGSVYFVTRIADRQTFVLKQMQISNISDKEREAFETEVRVASRRVSAAATEHATARM